MEAAEVPASVNSAPFQSLFQSPELRTVLCCLLLTAAVLVSYNPVTQNSFLRFDDDRYIVDNAHVKAGLTWPAVKWAFTTYEEANWHPLTWLSHALDCELFGIKPAGHHYMNVLMHAINAVLLFLLLQRATGFSWRSLMVAGLFALHPINVESVAWAAERKNVLSMMFFLLALYAYGWYARSPGLGRYAAVFGSFTLALLSKPQVITFPFLLLLWDYWPLRRMGAMTEMEAAAADGKDRRFGVGWLVLEKVPLFLLSAASAAITMTAQRAGGAVKALSEYSLLLRVETAAVGYVRYLGKALWPAKLVAFYPHPTELYPAWQAGAAAMVLLLGTAWALRASFFGSGLRSGKQRYLAVGWFWFLGSLVPMIGLVQVGLQAMADRYAYLSFVGLFVMLVWLVADWAKAREISARWVAIPSVCCLLALGILTYRQVGYWHDTESFWLHTLASTKDNYVAEDNLGEFLFNQGRTEEAAVHFRAALVIRPDGLIANQNLGAYEDRRGNLQAAMGHYQMVADRAGDIGLRATAYGSLGFVYREMGQSLKAKQCFETALRLAPDRTRGMVGLGLIAQDDGDLTEAIRQYARAVSVQPGDVAYLLLAQALAQQGHKEEARIIYDRLSRLSPNLPEAQKEAKSLLSRN